jgi:hypothetical protein
MKKSDCDADPKQPWPTLTESYRVNIVHWGISSLIERTIYPFLVQLADVGFPRKGIYFFSAKIDPEGTGSLRHPDDHLLLS